MSAATDFPEHPFANLRPGDGLNAAGIGFDFALPCDFQRGIRRPWIFKMRRELMDQLVKLFVIQLEGLRNEFFDLRHPPILARAGAGNVNCSPV